MFSVRSPRSRATRCSAPKRSPVRRMADIAFCASTVPSKRSTPSWQRSQLPQGCELSPKYDSSVWRRQRVEALAFDALAFIGRIGLLDLHAAQLHVTQAVECKRIG